MRCLKPAEEIHPKPYSVINIPLARLADGMQHLLIYIFRYLKSRGKDAEPKVGIKNIDAFIRRD